MKSIILVASKADKAGMNIAEECEKLGLKIFYAEEDIIFVNELPDADAYIFLSRHKSESEKPCLSCHFPGNFGDDNSYGGEPHKLGMTSPNLEKIYIIQLNRTKNEWDKPELEKFQVILEATHHGPTKFDKPVLFVEIGSNEKEWENKSAGKLIAEAVKRTIHKITNETFTKRAIAFGGTHYPEKFTDIAINGEYAIWHILPKYQSENLTEEVFNEMASKSTEPIKYVIIDWKGINKKEKIIEYAKNKGLEIIKL